MVRVHAGPVGEGTYYRDAALEVAAHLVGQALEAFAAGRRRTAFYLAATLFVLVYGPSRRPNEAKNGVGRYDVKGRGLKVRIIDGSDFVNLAQAKEEAARRLLDAAYVAARKGDEDTFSGLVRKLSAVATGSHLDLFSEQADAWHSHITGGLVATVN